MSRFLSELTLLAGITVAGLSIYQYLLPEARIGASASIDISYPLLLVNLATAAIFLTLSILFKVFPGSRHLRSKHQDPGHYINPLFTLAGSLLILNTLARMTIAEAPLAGAALYFILAALLFSHHLWFFINTGMALLAFIVASLFLIKTDDLPTFQMMHIGALIIGLLIHAGKWKTGGQMRFLYGQITEFATRTSEEQRRLQSLLDNATSQTGDRERLLQAVAKLAGPLMTEADQTDALNIALLEVAESLQLHALAIYRNYRDSKDVLRISAVAYWARDNKHLQVDEIPFHNYSFQELGMPQELPATAINSVEIAQANDDNPAIQEAILRNKVRFLATIPIIVKGEWWGILGFTDSSSGRGWRSDKLNSIRTASSIIGNAIERFEAEEAVVASEESLRSLIDIAPIGIIVLDPEVILLANKTVRSMIPFDPGNRPKTAKFVNVIFPEDRDTVKSALAEIFDRQRRPSPVTIRVLDSENQLVHIEASGAPIVYQGKPAALAVLRNITSQQLYETGLREARKKAEEASEAKTRFLANMSHEIRTPLNGVLGMAQLLKLKDLPAEESHQIETILESSRGLLTILDDLLDFSKIESGKITVESLPFDLETLVQEARDLFAPVAGEKNLRLVSNIQSAFPGRFLGDAPKIRQILVNLISNAIKFTNQGGVTLNVEVEPVKPVKGAPQNTVKVHIEVVDTGIGIEKEQLDTIFESFTQADNSVTRKYGGTGLGLAITDRLVALMHGKISVQSQPGTGTSFVISIPLIAGEIKMGNENNRDREETAPLTGKVLLVEDNRINQLVALKFLEHLGFEVDSAVNGQEAVNMAEMTKYDIVLMDIQMPVMDGITACREIRKIPGSEKLPVIAMTANAMEGDRDSYIEAGLDDYIAKPVHLADLEKILRANLKPADG